ncbi:hypothetical protein [Paenibacillus sp. UMB4589-SE434]|uniref:hypothetical protein n=1 Tax=Paenibacillus sp. UMB4589-SE434 TaxID=3046314 RepID=UPI00254F6E5E|nr:hypothetical protein [Paenibacillus sp. UMB4589-SE434]MDK8180958.1 hypothetical protein [Paenibacillus sp. UMB4589-SE434]
MIDGRRAAKHCLRLCLFILFAASVPYSTHAEPVQPIPWEAAEQSKEMQHLLQQSLSIQELDQEIRRITTRQGEAATRRQELEDELKSQEAALFDKQDQAGRVLRAYYIGERDTLLAAALSADRWSDMFKLLDYYQFLIETDQNTLTSYRNNVKHIDRLHQEQAALEKDLSQVRTQLIAQRDRLIQMKSQLDNDVAGSKDPAAMQQLIAEFNKYWQSVGLFEVKHYFKAIAQSMQKLPDFIQKNGNLTSDGLNYTVSIKDSELNEFLSKQDPLFKDFSFVFRKGTIAAVGEREGIKVIVEGSYTLENDPEHAIRFHVERLQFNGLELPESTRKQLEEQFDLNFYPQQLIQFIEAKEVTLEPHVLTVKLSVKW